MIFTCYKENFKSVKTLVFFFLCLLGDLIDLVPCITKSLSSTELTDNVTSNEKKRHPAIWMKWIFKTDSTHYHLYSLEKVMNVILPQKSTTAISMLSSNI